MQRLGLPLIQLLVVCGAFTVVAGGLGLMLFLFGAAAVFFPRHRIEIIAVATIFAAPTTLGTWGGEVSFHATAAGLGMAVLFVAVHRALAKRNKLPLNPVGPVLVALLIYAGMGELAYRLPHESVFKVAIAWAAVGLIRVLWYFAYDLLNKPESVSFDWSRIAFYRPVWSVFFIAPMPQGERGLKAHEAGDDVSLRKLRWQAVVLAAWGAGLYLLGSQVAELTYGSSPADTVVPGPQPVAHLLDNASVISLKPVLNLWRDVFVDFLFHIVEFTGWGHVIVAVVWFFGYKIPLNTRAPLLARDPLDFFQRYNYYYKELLWQIFFFPVFAKLARLPLALRLYLTTWAAVGAANWLILWARYVRIILEEGVAASVQSMTQYMIYCTVLVHMVFPFVYYSVKRPPGPVQKRWKHVLAAFATVLAYAILRIFDDDQFGDVRDNLAVFSRLFG